MMRMAAHPGPEASKRRDLVACGGRPISVSLQAGIPLELAVREALADQNIDSAWLTISGAPFQTLDYVIPDHAQDDQHVAWYSKTHHLADGFITRLGMIVGRYNGQSFIHGHGLWSDETTQDALGHILAPSTILTEPVVAKGIGLIGARFEREPDAETNFDLFHIQDFGAEVGDYAALRLAPNQDFTQAVEEAVADLGWSSANVLGIGSLVGASFQNGETLESLPTEFLITDAHVGPNAPTPEILIVGVDGKNVMSGRLKRGENAVLVTSELVLHRTG